MEPLIVTTTMSTTLAYTLPSGVHVLYYRTVDAGQLLIAMPLYAIVVILLFAITMQMVRERR